MSTDTHIFDEIEDLYQAHNSRLKEFVIDKLGKKRLQNNILDDFERDFLVQSNDELRKLVASILNVEYPNSTHGISTTSPRTVITSTSSDQLQVANNKVSNSSSKKKRKTITSGDKEDNDDNAQCNSALKNILAVTNLDETVACKQAVNSASSVALSNKKPQYRISEGRKKYDDETILFTKPIPKEFRLYPENQLIKTEHDIAQPDFIVHLKRYVNIVESKETSTFAKQVAVEQISLLMDIDQPPMEMIDSINVVESLTFLSISGHSDMKLIATALHCLCKIVNIADENETIRMDIILSVDPIPTLVGLIKVHHSFVRENVIRLLNSIGFQHMELILKHETLEAILQVFWTVDPLEINTREVIFQAVKILKYMCKELQYINRIITKESTNKVFTLIKVGLEQKDSRTFEFPCDTLCSIITHMHTSGDDKYALVKNEIRNGILNILLSFLETSRVQSIKADSARVLATYFTTLTAFETDRLLIEFRFIPILLKLLCPLSLNGRAVKYLVYVVKCLSILSVNHNRAMILTIRQYFDETKMAEWFDSYNFEGQDKELADYARQVIIRCFDSDDV